jgi:MoxR-like ATPase
MNLPVSLAPKELTEFLLNVATVRPVFIWGPPGIGKSALVQQFARQVGLDCVSLLGSQIAPEDLIGVPQIVDGVSRFCPPSTIARKEAYCLFLDELNACSQEVQKAFYSLIHERRIGEYLLPKSSVVIGAGNRAQDSAIVKSMSSALLNRMVHVQLRVSHREWLEWAHGEGIHSTVIEYLQIRPDHLWNQPPKTEEAFSTPRSWHMLSDALKGFGDDLREEKWIEAAAFACLTPAHAAQFKAFIKQIGSRYQLNAILKGDVGWPHELEQRDVLYFLAQSLRAKLLKELPEEKGVISGEKKELAHRAKSLIKELSALSFEMAQLVVASDKGEQLPAWFMVEIVRDLPRLVEKRDEKAK